MPASEQQRYAWRPRAFALLVACCAVFSPAVIAGYVFDDFGFIVDNVLLHDVAGLIRCWTDVQSNSDYYPVTMTGWWLQYQLWGLDPLGYHVVNVLLHLCNACLVWAILLRLKFRWAW